MLKRVILISVAILIVAAGMIPIHVVEVRKDGAEGPLVFFKRVSSGDTFSLTWTHSVENSPVTDYFRIDDRYRIILYESEFRSLNTGMPAVVSKGEAFSRTGDAFHLYNIERVLPEIILWVHEDYGGLLAVRGKTVLLPSAAGNGRVRIAIAQMPLWRVFYGDLQS